MTLKSILDRWPLVRQIRHGADGTGLEARSEHTRTLLPKQHGAEVARSVCPYCAVGCGQLIYHKDGKLVSIEGDPASPVSRGRLCPKGSASFELLTHPARLDKVRYRRARGTEWEELDLEQAMDMIAERLIAAREAGWQDSERHGWRVDRTLGFAHLGGATLDNEENYLIKKLMTALGVVQVENQARI